MIVVDASVVVDALTHRSLTDLRRRLSLETLHAPDLVDHEVVSALRGLTLGGHLGESRARDALSDFDDLALRRHPSTMALRERVWALRHNLTSYDAAYVAVAEQLGCALWTRDARIAAGLRAEVSVEVV
ncbi:MAG: type II toxin-antitoxin system VapC family toxin [Actinomycetales bacterium]